MQTNAYSLWSIRVVTFFMSALMAVSVVYWGLKGGGATTHPAALPVALVGAPPVDPQAVARALGGGLASATLARADAPAAASRYVLAGVVADRSRGGAALISVDGKAAKPVRVGTRVDGGLFLQSVAGRRAVLAVSLDAPAEVTLDLPPPTK